MFKIGDFVKVKEGTILKSGETINNWAGEIKEIEQKEKTCLLQLDAITIDCLSDHFLMEGIESGYDLDVYYFNLDEIELIERRDTDQQAKMAYENMLDRLEAVETRFKIKKEEIKSGLLGEFKENDRFSRLNDYQKEIVDPTVNSFLEFILGFEDEVPFLWTPDQIKWVCTDLFPAEVVGENKVFENCGYILIQFLHALEQQGYITDAKPLVDTLEKIRNEIPKKAKDQGNWTLSKILLMSAQESGVDINDEEELDQYLRFLKTESTKEIELFKQEVPVKEDPFKGIGRNDKINGRYKDGKIVEQIKFKKIEKDLRAGICDIC